MKVYVVVKVSFSYNDEFYDSLDGNPGHPVEAYRSREKAEQVVLQKTIKELRGLNLAEYSQDLDNISDDIAALERCINGSTNLAEKCSECDKVFGGKDKFCADCGAEREQEGATFSLEDYDTAVIPKTISDEQAAEIAGLLRIKWFEVIEVEMEDSKNPG